MATKWVVDDTPFATALSEEGISLHTLAARIGGGLWRLKQIIKHRKHPPVRMRERMATALAVAATDIFVDLND